MIHIKKTGEMRDWAKQEYWSIQASTQNSLSYPAVPAERSRKYE